MTDAEPLKPTIVLVHGAFEDGSIWNGVIERLQRNGYPVVAFANPLQGVAVDAAYLASLVDRIEGPLILVAHSYGGAVITQAGANEPRVKALVYAAAVMPAVGEAAFQLIGRFPGSSFPTSVEEVTTRCPTEPLAHTSSTRPRNFVVRSLRMCPRAMSA